MKNEHFHCAFCDTLTKTKIVPFQIKREGQVFEMQTKAEVCPNCNEKYYDGDTLIKFEKVVDKILP